MNRPASPASRIQDLLKAAAPKISIAISESIGGAVAVEPEAATSIAASDIISLGAADSISIQFALASSPNLSSIITIRGESMGAVLAAAEMSMQPLSTDELTTSGRPYLEAIVHGLCLAATDLTGMPAAATGLSVKSELPTAPGSASGEEYFRLTFLASSGDEASTTLHWIVPGSLVAVIVPPEAAEDLELESVGGGSRGGQVTDERLELLLDIPLEITVELGRVNMEVREVLGLTAGSIVEISKAAGEPVDVLVNGRPVARGEVVVIEDNFGVRITEILSPRDRLSRLQGAA